MASSVNAVVNAVEIAYLADAPDAIPTLATWHTEQWSHLRPERTLQQRITRLETHLQRGVIPTTFVALRAGQVLGNASLVDLDMDSRPEFTPWLGSVYVDANARRQGFGAMLVRRVIQEARDLGHPRLYLFTEDQDHFYTEMGWQSLEQCDYLHHQVTVMALDL